MRQRQITTITSPSANTDYITHVAWVLDMSASMRKYSDDPVKVTDSLVSYLAQRSKELDQETRASVYTFNYMTQNVYYDKDVLRLPSMAGRYQPNGRTALRDAVSRVINDLKTTSQIYGNHAFLIYALTDAWDNESYLVSSSGLSDQIAGLPENWTVAALVPNSTAVFEAKGQGFAAGNIEIWNSRSDQGIAETEDVLRTTADNFMVGRTRGVTGTRNLFSTSSDRVNTRTISQAGLGKLARGSYHVWDVPHLLPFGNRDIRPFVESRTAGQPYLLGNAYYQLTKRVLIQASKRIVIRNKNTGEVYGGPQARELLGLPDMDVRVSPDQNPDYEIFVQSKSVNRKLVPGTKVLYMRSS